MSEPCTVELSYVAERLSRARSVLIVGHTNPDGDAMGSTYALGLICHAMGKEVRVVTPEPPADRLAFLAFNAWALLTPKEAREYEVVCTVDVASPGQLGSLAWLSEERLVDLMLDHHGTGEPFAPHYVDPTASAAGEIIWRLYMLLRERGAVPAIPEASRGIYAAILSDTGSFKFSNVTPATHRIAAELVEEINFGEDGGMTTEVLCRVLFGRRTMKDLQAQRLAIEKLTVHAEGKLGIVMLMRQELDEAGLDDADVSGAVEVPRSLDGVEIALAMRQSAADPTAFKVSSRSNCEVNVAELCAAFGGGGHPKAAGCTITAASPEEALEVAVRRFAP